VQVVMLLGALSRRAYEVSGEAIEPEALLRAASLALSRAAQQERASAASGPVVSLQAVRVAREPAKLGYITLTPEPATFATIDGLAERLHGEANAATRSLVLQAALASGLEAIWAQVPPLQPDPNALG
jgi:hypothetical protein